MSALDFLSICIYLNQVKSSLYICQPGPCSCNSNIYPDMVFRPYCSIINFKIRIHKFLVKFLVSSPFDIFSCESDNICSACTFGHVRNANANTRSKYMANWTDFEPYFRYYCSSDGENCNHIKHIIHVLSEISKNIFNSISLGA